MDSVLVVKGQGQGHCDVMSVHFCEQHILETPGGNFIMSKTNIHLDSWINQLVYESGQTDIQTATSLVGSGVQPQCSNSSYWIV